MEQRTLRITGLFTLRRSSGSGFRSPRSVATLLPTAHFTHSLPALKMLRIFLFGLSNRRKQPERYAKRLDNLFSNMIGLNYGKRWKRWGKHPYRTEF
jgi:hypothetical protein